MIKSTPGSIRQRAPRRRGSRARLALATLLALAVVGCGPTASPRRELTQRERDSTLGKSVIPGAVAVTRTLEESDKASGSARQMDALVDSLAR